MKVEEGKRIEEGKGKEKEKGRKRGDKWRRRKKTLLLNPTGSQKAKESTEAFPGGQPTGEKGRVEEGALGEQMIPGIFI